MKNKIEIKTDKRCEEIRKKYEKLIYDNALRNDACETCKYATKHREMGGGYIINCERYGLSPYSLFDICECKKEVLNEYL